MLPFFNLKLIQKRSFLRDLGRIDWIGGSLFIASMTSLLLGITWGGVQYSWSSYKTWLPILLGGFGLIVDFIYEILGPREPFIPFSVLHDVSSSITFFLTMVQGLIVSAAGFHTVRDEHLCWHSFGADVCRAILYTVLLDGGQGGEPVHCGNHYYGGQHHNLPR